MTVKIEGETDKRMVDVLSRKPVIFHTFIRRLKFDQVPSGKEADWLRSLYQEKDIRFEQLINKNTLDAFVPNFPPHDAPIREQSIKIPQASKCKIFFEVFFKRFEKLCLRYVLFLGVHNFTCLPLLSYKPYDVFNTGSLYRPSCAFYLPISR